MRHGRKLFAGLGFIAVCLQGEALWADEVCTTTLDPQGKVIEQSCTDSQSSVSTSQSSEAIISGPDGEVVLGDNEEEEEDSCQLIGFDPGNSTAPYQFQCRDKSGLILQFNCADPLGELCTQKDDVEVALI